MGPNPAPTTTALIVRVTVPVKTRLTELVAAKQRETGRVVTYAEIIEDLLAKAGTA